MVKKRIKNIYKMYYKIILICVLFNIYINYFYILNNKI